MNTQQTKTYWSELKETKCFYSVHVWMIHKERLFVQGAVGKSFHRWGGEKKAALPQGPHAVHKFVNQMSY